MPLPRLTRLVDLYRTIRAARRVAAPRPNAAQPVVIFNASTRLSGHSQNAAFSLIAAWALREAGVPVIHFACQRGLTRCVLGANPEKPNDPMPCATCVRQSRINTHAAHTHWLTWQTNPVLDAALAPLKLDSLLTFHFSLGGLSIPLGPLVVPALRWRLRLHHLVDDDATRALLREFIRSAWNVARAFSALLDQTHPQAALVFNGQFYPEATAAWLCRQRGIRVITHEVGLLPLTGYFTTGEATAYPIHIPASFELNDAQNARLDAYLQNRFQGNFSMAGVQFWPEMRRLDDAFLTKAAAFKHLVPVFTNVIFDTSQPHANTLYPEMFTWLNDVLAAARAHPDTLFVIRAHPDESRPGKSARESVSSWVARTGADREPNIHFVPSEEFISSYELIQRAKFVLIYNSTIGLEAAILGAAVLSAGKARFTQYPTVYHPPTREDYLAMLGQFLAAEKVNALPEHAQHARRFLYYQLFRTSLPFDAFLEPAEPKGYVRLKDFPLTALHPENSPTLATLLKGILGNGDLLLEE